MIEESSFPNFVILPTALHLNTEQCTGDNRLITVIFTAVSQYRAQLTSMYKNPADFILTPSADGAVDG